jgi:hypothetical protein
MRAAKIENDVVTALWEVPALNAFAGVTLVEASTDVAMGDIWNGTVFVKKQRDVDETAEQAASIRSSRTEKLKECDWTQVADAPVDKAAWATYRQALRDVTQQAGFPWDVQWPF